MAKTDFRFSDKNDSTGFLLRQVTNHWQREIKKALERYDLTHAQFVLLASILWLSQTKDSITQIEISSHANMDAMTTSTVLRTLQAKGLISRQEHPTDTRAKTIQLTPEGKNIVKKSVKTVEQFDAAFFAPLGASADAFNQKLLSLLNAETQE